MITSMSFSFMDRDVETSLKSWQIERKTSEWAKGLRFIQFEINTRYYSGMLNV